MEMIHRLIVLPTFSEKHCGYVVNNNFKPYLQLLTIKVSNVFRIQL